MPNAKQSELHVQLHQSVPVTRTSVAKPRRRLASCTDLNSCQWPSRIVLNLQLQSGSSCGCQWQPTFCPIPKILSSTEVYLRVKFPPRQSVRARNPAAEWVGRSTCSFNHLQPSPLSSCSWYKLRTNSDMKHAQCC